MNLAYNRKIHHIVVTAAVVLVGVVHKVNHYMSFDELSETAAALV